MTLVWFILIYTVLAGACIFGFLVAATKCTDFDPDDDTRIYVICGALWPLTLAPVAGYLAAGWFINNR